MTKGKYTKGFTLVELLVVIAIIAILAGAMFLVINPDNLLRKSRDSRRIADITEVNKALAASIADGKIVMSTTAYASGSCTGTFVVDGSGWVGGWVAGGSMSTFMSALPKDPKNTTPNCYVFVSNTAGQWEFNTVLESPDNAPMSCNDGGNAGACTGVGATCVAGSMPSTTCRYEIGTNLTIV